MPPRYASAAAALATAEHTQQGEAAASPTTVLPFDDVAVGALRQLLPAATWRSRPDLQYSLTDKLLTQRILPAMAMRLTAMKMPSPPRPAAIVRVLCKACRALPIGAKPLHRISLMC